MASTVIGEGLTIEGEVSGEEEFVIHGTVRGTLSTSGPVQVSQSGVIEADVTGSSLTIAGQVTGNATAQDRVDIQSGGRLLGDVKASRLTIADGASFKGSVDMDV